MAIEHEVLTAKEVSEILQIHPSTVRKLVREGKIPAFRIGSDLRFRSDMMVRWMAKNTKGAPQ